MERTLEASDESLLAAYRGGDATAFETLFHRSQAPLCRHLGRMLDDRAAAEDLVIETFQRLHAHRDRVAVPAIYYLIWLLVVGPLNDALGVEG